MNSERIGVFGGTFDPVHVGHLAAALDVRHVLGLDRMLMVVAADPWQKRGSVQAPAEARFEMLEAAIDGVEGLEASRIEIERDGPSYTADTLETLSAPDRELFLVLGADAVRGLESWDRVETIRRLATVVVVTRDGDADAVPPGEHWRVERVAVPRLDVSSTDLRQRIGRGAPIDFLVPPGAVRVIRRHRLYTRP